MAPALLCPADAPVVAARLYDNTYERPEGAQRGRLEVQLLRRGWGTVCDSAGTFGKREATVACRTLNLTGGVVLRKSEFQNSEQCCGIRPILMGNVKCKGGEASLSGCSYTTSPKCTPEQEVGVMCDGECRPGASQPSRAAKERHGACAWLPSLPSPLHAPHPPSLTSWIPQSHLLSKYGWSTARHLTMGA